MRPYHQTRRAAQTEANLQRVLEAAERLFSSESFDRVSLDAIAREAEVSIPTLQRRFENKEGLFRAVADRVRERVLSQRGAPPRNDPAMAIAQLVEHYEREGRMMWHLLKQEDSIPLLREALDGARAMHREWVGQVFEESLRQCAPKERRLLTDALVAATDLFVWKLLRLDMGRSLAHVEQSMLRTVNALSKGQR